MSMDKPTLLQDDRLLDFLDGNLEGSALLQLKTELEASASLRNRLEELRAVHKSLSNTRLESPSSGFVSRVMQNLHSPSFSPSLSPRTGLLLLMGVLVASGLLVMMVSAGSFDQWTGLISLDQAVPIKKYFQESIPTFRLNVKLLITVLIGLNLFLAFVVLDRTVLKPFFQRRAAMH